MTSIQDVLEERGSRYGDFSDHAYLSQAMKYMWDMSPGNKRLENSDIQTQRVVREGVAMICHKLARAMNGDPTYADTFVDIAGYAKLVADHLEQK